MTALPKRRGGPTQSEADRVNPQVKLRLPPEAIEDLEALAHRWRLTRSETVARAVEYALAHAEIRDELG